MVREIARSLGREVQDAGEVEDFHLVEEDVRLVEEDFHTVAAEDEVDLQGVITEVDVETDSKLMLLILQEVVQTGKSHLEMTEMCVI